jgi:hypothetical protein
MEPNKVVRLTSTGQEEEVLATELQVGDEFIDDVRKVRGIGVEQRSKDGVLYRESEGQIKLLGE